MSAYIIATTDYQDYGITNPPCVAVERWVTVARVLADGLADKASFVKVWVVPAAGIHNPIQVVGRLR